MSKDNLIEKVKDSEQAEEEILFLREDYGAHELIESFNKEYYFIRCKDKESGEVIEEKLSISHITKNSNNLNDAYLEIRNFISNKKAEGVFGMGAYGVAYSNIKSEEKEKKPESKNNGPHSIASLSAWQKSLREERPF